MFLLIAPRSWSTHYAVVGSNIELGHLSFQSIVHYVKINYKSILLKTRFLMYKMQESSYDASIFNRYITRILMRLYIAQHHLIISYRKSVFVVGELYEALRNRNVPLFVFVPTMKSRMRRRTQTTTKLIMKGQLCNKFFLLYIIIGER